MVALSSVILLHRSPHVHTDNEQSSEQDQNPAAKMAKRERWEEGTHLNQTDLPLDLLWVAELRGAPRALSWPSLQVWHVPPIPNFQPSPSCCSLFFLSAQAQVKISCFSKSSIRRTFFFFFSPHRHSNIQQTERILQLPCSLLSSFSYSQCLTKWVIRKQSLLTMLYSQLFRTFYSF